MVSRWFIIALLLALAGVSLWPVAQAQQGGTPAVVINEVAWAGTAASASDEWIELYNNTSQEIDLSRWKLSWEGQIIHFDKAADNTKEVRNSKIPAYGFYLLERSDDTAISDLSADLIYTGSLANEGEVPYATMERISSTTGDADSNWASNNGKVHNGLDVKGNPLNGTPKERNSASGG